MEFLSVSIVMSNSSRSTAKDSTDDLLLTPRSTLLFCVTVV